MQTDIFRIIYKSTAAHPAPVMLGQGHVAAILRASRRRNAATGVSGVLVYTGAGFLQVLEGSRPAVQTVFETLLVDRRHHTLSVIEMDLVPARRFGGWAMAFLGGSAEVERGLNAGGGPALGVIGDAPAAADLLREVLMLLVDSPISLPWSAAPLTLRADRPL
ncbi:BLUF domain-containing protein [Methylobacterium oryzihabitans]|uniref:BLUF domain-containing protein n=1 Tax=Methylobacterium oryzihabitans TaxID=2499852 RepID=A0A3S2V2P3_9HYPH|nr:BLUF domain-containing protein [Methylobacterium oryzihabitans]RVU13860.1 BLUF domain-containing protein [Methylobacterium oryzihabitans]